MKTSEIQRLRLLDAALASKEGLAKVAFAREHDSTVRSINRQIETLHSLGQLTRLVITGKGREAVYRHHYQRGVKSLFRQPKGSQTIDRKKLLELREQGLGPTEIARAIECTPASVHRIIGVFNNRKQYDKSEILRLNSEGKTRKEIMNAIGCSYSTVHHTIGGK